MKNKSKKILSTLLAVIMAFGLFAALPLTASAAEELFRVIENPTDATYSLSEVAKPLVTEFEFVTDVGEVNATPIKVQWYWSDVNSNASRSNKLGFADVEYDRLITCKTTHVPSTDAVGIKYYYAVLSYSEPQPLTTAQTITKEIVSAPAKIEVIDNNHGFRVKKVDENEEPLAGAVLSLIPDSDYDDAPSYEATTSTDGFVSFSVIEGYYILSEKRAPNGYNATDEKHYIHVTQNGVFEFDPETEITKNYELVTFINKKIPELNKEDHFAFMQGYPEGTFMSEKNMTRAEAVIMFSRLLTESMGVTIDYRNDYYSDVDSVSWYANQVGYMQSLGVLADYSRDGKFRPNDPVTRAEFATLAAHFDNLLLTDTNDFSDVTDSHWAVKYINSAAAKGWITGYPNGTFKPEAHITRAEVVTLVGRMLSRSADGAYLTANANALPRTYSDLSTSHWAYLAIMEASIGHDYTKDSVGEHWASVY